MLICSIGDIFDRSVNIVERSLYLLLRTVDQGLGLLDGLLFISRRDQFVVAKPQFLKALLPWMTTKELKWSFSSWAIGR